MVDVEPAFISDSEPSESVEPREAAFDDPWVAAEPLACLDAASCDPWLDLTTAAGVTAAAVVVSLVGVQLVWSASRSAAPAGDGRDGVKQVLERHTEPPRVCRRLQLLRKWSHDESDDEQVFS